MYCLYEAKKIYKNKALVFVLIILCVANYILIFNECAEIKDDMYIAREKLCREIEGELTRDKVNFIVNNYKQLSQEVASGEFSKEYNSERYTGYVFGDYNFFGEWNIELERIYNFPTQSQKIYQKAEKNIELFEMVNNREESKLQQRTKANIKDRQIDKIYDYAQIETYLGYDTSAFLVLMFVMLISVLAFASDKEMPSLINTTRIGKKRIKFQKVSFVIANAVSVSMVFFIMDLIVFAVNIGLAGWTVPLYYLPMYGYTPLNISVAGFFVVIFIAKLLAITTFSIICAFITMVIKKFLGSLSVAFILLILLTQLAPCGEGIFSYLNPLKLILIRENFLMTSQWIGVCIPFILLVVLIIVIVRKGNNNGYEHF
ncbi:MAG: hypothetical protein RRY52_06670 [Anaerovoracaceae bacterium]